MDWPAPKHYAADNAYGVDSNNVHPVDSNMVRDRDARTEPDELYD